LSDQPREGRKHPADTGHASQESAVYRAAAALCAFCAELPSGPRGHEGFAQQAAAIPATQRSYVRLACAFCGSSWVRRRLNARTFEWLRIAD
jgi:hypothetical protein